MPGILATRAGERGPEGVIIERPLVPQRRFRRPTRTT
jgi:hypothetical protein